jgi:two-component system chemotaxis response regulator CheB
MVIIAAGYRSTRRLQEHRPTPPCWQCNLVPPQARVSDEPPAAQPAPEVGQVDDQNGPIGAAETSPKHGRRLPRNVIVVGGSAGSLDAMLTIAAGLPRAFAGSVFVVSHIGPHRSHLPELLSRSGPLPAKHPEDGEPISPGLIYVAPPDRHMLVRPDVIRLSRGPRQHFTRPAVNPLFRSAAQTFGPRVIGIVLSGAGSDGAAGLGQVKRAGGIAVVQDPATALYPEMPRSAGTAVPPDHVVGAGELPALLLRLSLQMVEAPVATTMSTEIEGLEEPVALTCPECGGAVRRVGNGLLAEYRCHTGHRFSGTEMATEQSDGLDRAVGVAVRVLNERVELCRQMQDGARAAGRDLGVAHWQRLKAEAEDQLQILMRFLERRPAPTDTDPEGEALYANPAGAERGTADERSSA